jgi:hypothetical protein
MYRRGGGQESGDGNPYLHETFLGTYDVRQKQIESRVNLHVT